MEKIISRFSGLKTRALEIRSFLRELSSGSDDSDAGAQMASRCSANLSSCANYLVFHDYFTVGQKKLVKAHTCKQHLLCPFCAARRSAKQMARYVDRISQVMEETPDLKPIMITLTVKNGSDLAERFAHLQKAFQRLVERRRDYLKKGRGRTEFRKLHGALYSFEFTHSPENGWHPHVHMVALASDWIDRQELSREWQEVTGDSFIVDVRRITSRSTEHADSDLMAGLAEVLKYALKFSGMDNQSVWDAYRLLRGKRLMGSIGALRGVAEPDDLLDDPMTGLPYLEMFYRFCPGKSQYQLFKFTPVLEQGTSQSAATADSGRPGMEDPHPTSINPVKGLPVLAPVRSTLDGVYAVGWADPCPATTDLESLRPRI